MAKSTKKRSRLRGTKTIQKARRKVSLAKRLDNPLDIRGVLSDLKRLPRNAATKVLLERMRQRRIEKAGPKKRRRKGEKPYADAQLTDRPSAVAPGARRKARAAVNQKERRRRDERGFIDVFIDCNPRPDSKEAGQQRQKSRPSGNGGSTGHRFVKWCK